MSLAQRVIQLREGTARGARRLGEWSRRNRFWFESGGVTLLALAMLGVVAVGSLRRAHAWEAEARRLEVAETQMRSALAHFEPADSAERRLWAEGEAELRRLASEPDDPLAVASLVAQRAEAVGIGSVRVRLAREGGDAVPAPIEAVGWRAEAQPTALVVEFSQDIGAMTRLVNALPPNVELGSVRVDGSGPRIHGEVRLFARSFRGDS